MNVIVGENQRYGPNYINIKTICCVSFLISTPGIVRVCSQTGAYMEQNCPM